MYYVGASLYVRRSHVENVLDGIFSFEDTRLVVIEAATSFFVMYIALITLQYVDSFNVPHTFI